MELKEDYILFQQEITKRGIKYLIHFTECTNLLSIVQNRVLLSHNQLKVLNYEYLDITEINDYARMDGLSNYINISIEHPNYYLLKKFKERMNAPHISWCILKIDAKHIYNKDTLFSVSNAASSDSRNKYGISGDFEKFKLLFSDIVYIGRYTWKRNSIKPKYPTDIQAEILVKDSLAYDDIVEVCFEDDEIMNRIKRAFEIENADTTKFKVDKGLFLESRV